jgi:hypothetical protein
MEKYSMKTPENVKFWTVLAILILSVSVAVMLIDLSIKAAILEESNSLRRVILNGRGEERANGSGGSDDSASDSVLLDFHDSPVETGNVRQNGSGKVPATPRRKPRSKPRTQGDDPTIPSGN